MSQLFPSVVKNVFIKDVEIRKLVYLYLVYFSEVQPDAALLAINSLQKAMADPNPLLRGSALRCMSNIRVKDIAQLIVLAIQKGAKDTSPYVRKIAALAIPKILRLDGRHAEQCTEILEGLLCDHSPLVIGGAAQAYLEVCPERFDLLHPAFRSICAALPDIDEWGQVSVLTLLLQYGRSNFLSPDPERRRALLAAEKKRKQEEQQGEKKEGEDEDEEKKDEEEEEVDEEDLVNSIDPDHRLMLQSVRPLFMSRNNAVVLSACILYYYLAPPAEVSSIAQPMIRLLHCNRETQYVALMNILTMASQNPQLFRDHIQEFFIGGSESLAARALKLELLTILANEQNITRVLSEMREYTKDDDKEFVTAAIQAIGRCAAAIPAVADSCMQQLLLLMANPSQTVVAESIVVIKKLLQMNEHSSKAKKRVGAATAEGGEEGGEKKEEGEEKKEEGEEDDEEDDEELRANRERDVRIIRQLSKMLETIQVPQARAAIVWLVGEYCEKIPQRAPDTLRVLAKTFVEEDPIVKLQILTLAAKLFLSAVPPPPRCEEILKYVLQLAKYDQSFDIRDRARLIRQLLFSSEDNGTELRTAARTLFLAEKPVPELRGLFSHSLDYTLASLSHFVHDSAPGYVPLPDFPDEVPDSSVRNPAPLEDEYQGQQQEQEDIYDDDGWGAVDEDEEEEEEEEEEYEEGDDDGWGGELGGEEDENEDDDLENGFGDEDGEYQDFDDGWNIGGDGEEGGDEDDLWGATADNNGEEEEGEEGEEEEEEEGEKGVEGEEEEGEGAEDGEEKKEGEPVTDDAQ